MGNSDAAGRRLARASGGAGYASRPMTTAASWVAVALWLVVAVFWAAVKLRAAVERLRHIIDEVSP
jgi:hypothetical protein